MKKGIIYNLLFYASCMIFAAVKISEYVTTKNTADLILALVFIVLMLGYAIKTTSAIFKEDKKENTDVRIVILGFVLLTINLFMPNVMDVFKQQTIAEKDYASMLNFGRPTSYYKHIEADDFNELYQQLLDNNWSNFRLPNKVIAGNSTVRNVSTFGDNITVEYGDSFNTTVRFLQNRKGLTTSNKQFTKLAEKEYIADTFTQEIQIGNYTVVQETTKICSITDEDNGRVVYSYSWKTGNYSYFIETTCDMEKDFDEMQTMIESMQNINVSENP